VSLKGITHRGVLGECFRWRRPGRCGWLRRWCSERDKESGAPGRSASSATARSTTVVRRLKRGIFSDNSSCKNMGIAFTGYGRRIGGMRWIWKPRNSWTLSGGRMGKNRGRIMVF